MTRERTASYSALAAITALAAWLRLDRLGAPSYWLDEILGQIVMREAAAMPWWRWLIGFHPQHGPLYYAAQWLVSLLGTSEAAGRSFAASCGIVTVVLVWFVAREITGSSTVALAAALLLAVSPLHVYYSREARPYALLMLLATALLLAILRGAWRSAMALMVALLYTSVAATPIVAAAAVSALLFAWLHRDPRRRAALTIGVAAIATLPFFALLYRGAIANDAEAPFPGLSAAFFDQVVRGLGVTALGLSERGRVAYLLFAFVVVGAIAMARRNRAAFAAVAGMTLLPMAINLAALEASNHFFAIRYITAALPAYLVLAAAGIGVIVKRIPAAALPVAAIVAWQCWPAARAEAFRKLDWRTIGATIAHYAHDDDLVITAEPWSDVCLRYYLKRPLQVAQISIPVLADLTTTMHNGKWIVSVGTFGETPIRQWMCRYPMVMAGPLEGFRLHYAGDFLRERGTLAEERATSGAMGSRARLLPDEFNGVGWADSEGSFRWAVSRRATLTLPRFGARDRLIRAWMLPYRPPQSAQVYVNGALAGSLNPPLAWSEQRVAVPARFWRDGANEIAFIFDHAIAPATVEASHDQRTLAASFEWISVDDVGAPDDRAPRVRPVRIASVCLDCPPGRTNPRLLSRLGLDPALTQVDAAPSIAWGTECEDARAWLHRVFATLLDREPSPGEERDLLRETRERVVQRITRGREFRNRW